MVNSQNNWYIYGKLVLGNQLAWITVCYTCADIICWRPLEKTNDALIIITHP